MFQWRVADRDPSDRYAFPIPPEAVPRFFRIASRHRTICLKTLRTCSKARPDRPRSGSMLPSHPTPTTWKETPAALCRTTSEVLDECRGKDFENLRYDARPMGVKMPPRFFPKLQLDRE